MAGDWIAMRHDLAETPEVLRIASALDLDADAVVGKLHRVWSWVDRQSPGSGDIPVTGALACTHIDCITRAAGFAAAMREAGWLCIDGARAWLPNPDRWNTETAKNRLRNRRNQQAKRSREDDVEAPPAPPASPERGDKAVTTGQDSTVDEEPSSLREEGARPAPKRPKSWRTVPQEESLTEERLSLAIAEGLTEEQAQREWRKFKLHDFPRGHTDVDRTWLRWAIRAVEILARSSPRALPFPSHAERSVENLRRLREKIDVSQLGASRAAEGTS